MPLNKSYPYILIIGSIIGLLASFILTVDTFEFIKNPSIVLPCNINPLISCTNVANHWQSQIFGFPNSLLGILAFSMLFGVGVMLLSGGRSKKPLWLLVNLGTSAAMLFVLWFFFESVYRIGALCIYCMITWAVTWPLFLYTTVWNFRENHFSNFAKASLDKENKCEKFFKFISKNHTQILIAGYLVIILLIIFQFRTFFFS